MPAWHRSLPSLLLAAALGAAVSAHAAEIAVLVHDHGGAPVGDAVITLTADPGLPLEPAAPAEKNVDQKNETFVPYVETFRPGDRVVFRNSDSTRHHVYSFSRLKTFEFVLKPGESSPPLTLDRTGIAAVGCNIHDHMISYLFVTDALRVAKSGSDGRVRFTNLAPGHYTVHAWHPQLHPSRPEMSEAMPIAATSDSKTVEFALSLLPDPRMQMHDDYGQ